MSALQRNGPEGRCDAGRKGRGDYPTPPDLVARVVDAVLPPVRSGEPVTIVDPACGDGRFVVAAAVAALRAGGQPIVHGVELNADVAALARKTIQTALPGVPFRVEVADALAHAWPDRYDVVVGNPPFLSQLAAATTRGGSSRRGGGPYADVAAEFLDLAVDIARPGGGRVGLVLPQSLLASRDAGPIRAAVDAKARRIWSWWSPQQLFDAEVVVCALGFERRAAGNSPDAGGDQQHRWTDVIAAALGVPQVPDLATAGTVGDRALCTADFRDVYYGLAAATADDAVGPRLVTSGAIDPLHDRWGERAVRFGKRPFSRPRVGLDDLPTPLRRWAASMAVPKVLVANQTKVVECIVDGDGSTLPSVPVITLRPSGDDDPRHLAAVLTSPVATALGWAAAAGTGLSARAVRISPRLLAALPWPAGDIAAAVRAVDDGDVARCGRAITAAFGVHGQAAGALNEWWISLLPRR